MHALLSRLRSARRLLPMRVLLPLTLVLGLLWGFWELAEEVQEGDTRSMDEAVLTSLRTADPADPVGPGWLQEVGRDVTALGGMPLLTLAVWVACGTLWIRRERQLAGLLLGSISTGYALIYVLKASFARPRPELVAHGQEVYTASFPSGHSMGAAVVWLTLAVVLSRAADRRRLQAFLVGTALLVVVLVGASRVYLGVHWPSDVLGGWGVGAAWAVATGLVADGLARRRHRVETSTAS